eukprot:TRINITY_DN14441_c0_g1_i1.p1 TRINITY_DN14441_c0_g1~~TRINITY_DN14441_c0_g1_i1.p1  ORF type:complete len:825 (-),score=167.83 TRINITY_DN14441_c0_g1_i1:160-2634(-)
MFDLVIAILGISHAFLELVSCSGPPPTNGHSMAGASTGLVINTTSGMVQGHRRQVPDGPEIRTWQGIPYAQPPVGKLRFRPPEKVKGWKDIKVTRQPPPACPQPTGNPISDVNITNMDEDCLFLNIFSPELDSEKLYPVMIWIHSGGFNRGSSLTVDPARLTSNEQVIVVTLQYRLGALGFIYLGKEAFKESSAAYSNLGLRDQVAGIEWISQNIMAFGGDPTRVTLFGSEAGAVSASYHLQNVHVSNLIQGVILQSGGPINSWAKKESNTMKMKSFEFTKKAGCPTEGMSLVIECLENVEVSRILSAQNKICDNSLEGDCFVPIVDDDTVFSNDHVRNLSRTNKAILQGYNSNEGFLKLMNFLTKEFPTEKLHSEGFSREMFIKMLARMFPRAGAQTHAIIDFLYADDVELSPRASVRFLTLERIVADYMYNCGQEFIPKHPFNEHQSSLENDQQIFKYKFSWQPSKDRWPRWSGVKQGDEIQFIFGEPLNHPEDYLIEEKEFSKQVMAYWANFARTGSPNTSEPSWPEYSADGQQVMELNAIRSGMTQIEGVHNQRCKFWNNLLGRLQQISSYQCKTFKRSKQKKKHKDFDQKHTEIRTNEIERIFPSLSKSSLLLVDEPHSTTRRTVRGLNLKSPKGRQFIYKVKTPIPKDEQVRSTVKVLERSRPKKLFKRQLKLKNNTQISYKLNVDLENNPESQEPWAVYDTKVLGNSPIYIAPNKYQVNNQNPILNDDNLEEYSALPIGAFNDEGERGSFNTYNKKKKTKPFNESSRSKHSTSSSSSSYDPFYPNFDGFGVKKAILRSESGAVLVDEPESRPAYFPN